MLIEIITPLVLATSPGTSTTDSATEYLHESQQLAFREGVEKQEEVMYQSTRTFDYSGKPSDSDWD